MFNDELEFEEALVHVLTENYGWNKHVIKHPTEKELIQNWANILFQNNRGIDKLNGVPLTGSEMQQIIEQINTLKTPLKLNQFINGGAVSIIRDNPDDPNHLGKEVYLKIYNRREIAGGQSFYQIVEQPIFPTKSQSFDRRGDLMLLINGMPVIHIELKRSGIPVSQACHQIEKYSYEHVFTGLFSLIQVFVAMNPEETVYFANVGTGNKFNSEFYFHWADYYNEPINDWKEIASSLLSIPMAHQLIGFYTVADDSDGVLKVMRSYQYYAANAISDAVSKTKWDEGNQRGGYIWHTTGSGKTMTSFKSAQLIANSKDADKVVFLTDRIELGTQSFYEYSSFADDDETVQKTENTYELINKLKSNNVSDTLIVTSIQKMSNIKDDGTNTADIEILNNKRIVFIIDECHRSTFGEMLLTIKNTFPNALFFGFTGTPIEVVNQKKLNTTSLVFGNELHRYSIADGIRDKNVLGFDTYKVATFRDIDLRTIVALEKSKTKSEEEALSSEATEKIYYKYVDSNQTPMAGYRDEEGNYVRGIEDYISNSLYTSDEHQKMVVKDIKDSWFRLSRNSKFHALFATSSIPEAIDYYRLLKKEFPELRITCLFDPHISNEGHQYKNEYKGEPIAFFKEEGLKEIVDDYNKRYHQNFTLSSFAQLKKDMTLRLAHKEQYRSIESEPDEQLDMIIVVDQLLTGFDSKWINTLYLDKVLEYENIIQAFSRTNRVFNEEKSFGTIKYYRRPHTMDRNIQDAIKLYAGDKPYELFVEKLDYNLTQMNLIYSEIKDLFEKAGVKNFAKLPDEDVEKSKFAKLYNEFNKHLNAAKIQGFKWSDETYEFSDENNEPFNIIIEIDEQTNLTLLQRYKELSKSLNGNHDELPYEIEGYITELDSDTIDTDYMNSRFKKYLKALSKNEVTQEIEDDLHKSFASLSREEQKFANILLHDIQSGQVVIDEDKTFMDYIKEYQYNDKNDQIYRFAKTFGLDEDKLREIMKLHLTKDNINEFNRFDDLKKTLDKDKAQAYFFEKEGTKLPKPRVNMKFDKLLRQFILEGGFEI